jgi:hypothetical protein
LIGSDTGCDLEVLVAKDDLRLQELEPCRGGGAKDDCRAMLVLFQEKTGAR